MGDDPMILETVGAVHFLTLIGLWAIWLENKIEPWPQWTVPLAFLILIVGIGVAAGAVAVAYT